MYGGSCCSKRMWISRRKERLFVVVLSLVVKAFGGELSILSSSCIMKRDGRKVEVEDKEGEVSKVR